MTSIRVGLTLPQSGRYARNAGVTYEKTYRFWVEQVNATGGILGKDVDLVVYDDGSDPQRAAEGYRRLIFEDRVDLLLGPCHSDMVEGIASIIESEERVLLQGSGSSHEIFEKGRRQVFLCWSGSDFDYPRSMLEWASALSDDRRPRQAALVHHTGRIGSAVALGARHYADQLGVEIVCHEPMGAAPVDYAAVFNRVKDASPDLVLVGLDHARPDDPVTSTVRAYRDTGLDGLLWLSDNPSPHDATDLLDRAFMRTTWVPESPLRSSQQFRDAYGGRYGDLPEYHHAGGYACCQVLEQAVRAIGSCNQADLRAHLLTGEFETVMGRIRFNPNGLPAGSMQLSQWVDGALRIVYPDGERTGEAALD